MVLNEVIPWGRTLEEYRRMFSLSDADLEKRILGCGDGPASFNAELTAQGKSVISIDPVYAFSGEEIQQRFDDVYSHMVEAARENQAKYRWNIISSPDEMGQRRRNALNRFVQDYDEGKQQGRYLNGTLPDLPFDDNQFDLALCSHLLFTYSHLLDADFHLKATLEMLRVAMEVRIFPLLTLNGRPSSHLDDLQQRLQHNNAQSEVVTVNYEFQIGGDKMLRVWKMNP
ncbi:class I SAM-dependent methyltransferase [bacterium]|nr:class I SAM-dependent methyltransferase [bacterium]